MLGALSCTCFAQRRNFVAGAACDASRDRTALLAESTNIRVVLRSVRTIDYEEGNKERADAARSFAGLFGDDLGGRVVRVGAVGMVVQDGGRHSPQQIGC